ncbi:MAG: PAS domain S-box protein [Gemmatimonadetes bacterium]|nr:PAS domain S-box protein [Gemmatimonadota bacterium]
MPSRSLPVHAADVAVRSATHMPAMLAYWDEQERCRYANDAYLAWFRRTPEEMDGVTLRELLGPLYALNERHIKGALRGEPQEFERRIPIADGTVRDSLATYTPDVVDGVVRGFVAHVVDVTEVKARLNRLREAEAVERVERATQAHTARLQWLMANVRVGILVQGRRSEVLACNPAAYDLLGLTEAQLMGASSLDPSWNVIHEDGTPFPGETHPVPVALATGRPVHDVVMGVWRPKHRDRVWLLVNADPQVTDAGEATEVICTFVDITERRQIERDLREARTRLDQAIQAGHVGLWDLDVATHRLHVSAEAKRSLGFAEDEIGDSLRVWMERVHPDDLARVRHDLRAWLRGELVDYEFAHRVRHRDGSWRHLLVRGSRRVDTDGRATRLEGATVDVTERVELEARLLRSQKLESIGRLAGGVAHDFNNLLTVIMAAAEGALHAERTGGSVQGDLEEIVRTSERAAALTHQLLAFSRRQVLTPAPVDLNDLMRGMTGMLRRLVPESVEMRWMLARGAAFVMADRAQVEQVVMNLVVNAVEAMPDGGHLTIGTEIALREGGPDARRGARVLLRVSDTGAGFDEATRQRIFEPFFTTKALGQNSGLGLATVYGVVKQSGGDIEVESTPGQGTTFTVTLPQVAAPAEGAARPEAPGPSGSETVLVVEDEEAVRRLLVRLLRDAGYETHAAAHGAEALEFLAEHPASVHLLVTDMVMPGMDGRELATRARSMRPDLGVLFTSGYTTDPAMSARVVGAGDAFLRKPYSRREMLHAVRRVLDASRSGT